MNQMSIVQQCELDDCAYNTEQQCHALGITVGHDSHECDTYYSNGEKGGQPDLTGGVGACQADSCKYNEHLICGAPSIKVSRMADLAGCATYIHV
jgi:hypothetical protein